MPMSPTFSVITHYIIDYLPGSVHLDFLVTCDLTSCFCITGKSSFLLSVLQFTITGNYNWFPFAVTPGSQIIIPCS